MSRRTTTTMHQLRKLVIYKFLNHLALSRSFIKSYLVVGAALVILYISGGESDCSFGQFSGGVLAA